MSYWNMNERIKQVFCFFQFLWSYSIVYWPSQQYFPYYIVFVINKLVHFWLMRWNILFLRTSLWWCFVSKHYNTLTALVFRDQHLEESMQPVIISSPQITSSLNKDRKRSAEVLWHSQSCGCQGNAWKWFCNVASVSPSGVQIRSALPPSLQPTPPCLYHPSVFGANRMSNNPNIVNTLESNSLTGALAPISSCYNKSLSTNCRYTVMCNVVLLYCQAHLIKYCFW